MPVMKDNTEKFEWVDFGRAIAILLVIMIHSGQFFGSQAPGFTIAGDLGVQLFFILSAFTLFTSYNRRFVADSKNRNLFFFIRRIFRIAPLYTCAAIFYMILQIYQQGPASVQYWKVILTVLYLNGIILTAIQNIPPGSWSIGTEMLFYLIVPFLFAKITSLRKAVIFLISSIVLSNVINYADMLLVQHFTSKNYEAIRMFHLFFWLPNQLPVFGFGIFLYYLFTSITINRSLKRIMLLSSIILFFALAYFPFSLKYPTYFFQREYVYSVVFSLFIIGIKDLRFDNIIGKFFLLIGKYSFAMYLSHFFVLQILAFVYREIFNIELNGLQYFVFYASAVLLTTLLSSVLHQLEKFAIKKGNNLITAIKSKNTEITSLG